MKSIGFSVSSVQIELEEDYEKSKFFGSPVFPRHFFRRQKLDNWFFLAQVDLSVLPIEDIYIPSSGMLYFFLNVENTPYDCKVLYTTDNLVDLYDNIDEYYTDVFGQLPILYMEFNDEENGNLMFNESCDNIYPIDTKDYIELLKIDYSNMPKSFPKLQNVEGYYSFLIKKSDLLETDFSKIEFFVIKK